MNAVGIDVGGTKIEAQIFDGDWECTARQRCATPTEYIDLVAAIADKIAWAEDLAGSSIPVGIGAAGLINPASGLALTANLVATGHPFPADIATAAGRDITYINDCRALALSEAVFGVGKQHHIVLALILGTGVGGGICVGGSLLSGPTTTGGEFGHTSAPAHLVSAHSLPMVQCGCGRIGCIETFVAGPGMKRMARLLTGQMLSPAEIASQRNGEMADIWKLWCDLTADLIHSLTLTVDPDLIVLGGGLSKIDGVAGEIAAAAQRQQIGDFGTPPIVIAQGGDSSGARGAAVAAWQEKRNA